jgi:hypothetical protein
MATTVPPPRIGKTTGNRPMPSRSKSQARLLQAAAHTKGGFGGVPQSVGRDFASADKKAGKRKLPQRIGRGLINRSA